jgi:ABC-type multidrug transport system ATPase subunit
LLPEPTAAFSEHFENNLNADFPGESRMTFFAVEDLSMTFGGLKALDKVSFEITKGEIFAVIGPNGAGKTTLFNCINGIYPPTGGILYLKTTISAASSRTGCLEVDDASCNTKDFLDM